MNIDGYVSDNIQMLKSTLTQDHTMVQYLVPGDRVFLPSGDVAEVEGIIRAYNKDRGEDVWRLVFVDDAYPISYSLLVWNLDHDIPVYDDDGARPYLDLGMFGEIEYLGHQCLGCEQYTDRTEDPVGHSPDSECVTEYALRHEHPILGLP